VCNFGYAWYTDTLHTRTQYRPYTTHEIEANVGLHVGLRGINITLLGTPEYPDSLCTVRDDGERLCERVNYNERFWWADPWAQGRIGFGRYAGRLNQEFRASQYRGDPYPIQWIAEYFTLDGEQIRWARKFRQAGWYAHIFLWLAFALYLIAAILFTFSVRHGGIVMMWIGMVMILAIFTYGVIIINDPPLVIPFAEGMVRPAFGWSWYLVLVTGLLCLFLGILIVILDYFIPRKIAIVFNRTLIEEDDVFYVEDEETPETKDPGLGEYGVSTRGSNRYTRRQTVSKFRQTQRKSRKTTRSTRSGQLDESGDIALQNVSPE
jgi:hypothetical protein